MNAEQGESGKAGARNEKQREKKPAVNRTKEE
jgi:hypothetical protein